MVSSRIKKNSITILLSSVAILIFINVSITFYHRNALTENLLLKNETDQFKSYTNSILSDVVHGADLSVRGYALTKKERFTEPLRKVFQNKDSLFNSMQTILTRHGHGLQEFNGMKEATENYLKLSQQMLALVDKDSTRMFLELLNEDRGYDWWKKFEPFRTSLFQYEDELNVVAQKKYETALRYNSATQIVLLLLGIPTILLIIFRMKEERKNRIRLLTEVDQSNRKYVFDSGRSTAISDSIEIVKNSIENLRSASEFITNLSNGNMNVHWSGLTQENELLNKDNLAGKLVQLRKNLNQSKIADEKRIWTNEGLTKFSELVRNHQHSVESLSLEVVKYLTNYLRAQQGGLFVLQGGDEPYLKLTACYAFERKKYIEKNIKVGEGLIGQAYLEGETVFLKEIPKGYIQITSGLGDATPNCVAIVPMKYNDKIEAIIELASFQVFEKHQIEFLEKAGEFVASALVNTNAGEKMQYLLSQSQYQAENMRSAEEELRQNMEEMEATQEEMARREMDQKREIQRLNSQYEESLARFKRLSLVADNTDNSVVITDATGLIEYVNNGFTKLTGYRQEEVVGKKPGSFLQGRGTNPDTVNRIREKLNLCQPFYEEILNYDKSGKDYWISLAINPIIEDGKLSKFISIQSNVTLTKLQAQEFTAQVEAIGRSNSIVSFDLKGVVQSANKNFLEVMGYTFEEVISRHHRMFVFNEESNSEAYKQMWKDLSEGKFVSGEFKRKTKDGKEIWLNGTYTAIMDLQGNPYKVMKFAQDITIQKQLAQASQQQNEQLRTNEEELRQNMEEIASSQEDLQRKSLELNGIVSAVNSTLANIEFTMEGDIIMANENFLNEMGYSLEEIKGQHHKLFVDEEYAKSKEYAEFWDELNFGKAQTGEVRRVTKAGNEIWFTASYTPVLDENNKPFKIIKFAQNITAEKLKSLEFSAQVNAIGQSNSIVSFDLNGIIQNANENFLNRMGYQLTDIVGMHHRIFVPAQESISEEYKKMWKDLSEGKFVSGEFRRKTKDGNEVWLNGVYVPILDLQGKPYKVMKFAQDITIQKQLAQESLKQNALLKDMEEELRQNMKIVTASEQDMHHKSVELNGIISAVNATLANIEFDMKGYIITANDNFLKEMGYSLKEIVGKHHKLFVDKEYAYSNAYIRFWEELSSGQAQIGEVKQYTKTGIEIWFSASYTPVNDINNRPFKVIKFAQNITHQKQLFLDFESQMSAIDKSYAVIEFDLEGNILKANENFLSLMEYSLDEIRGRHHKIFVDREEAQSSTYRMFWKKLNAGEYITSEFTRLAKSGKEVRIKGSYSPIKDINGKPYKIVKYALEIKHFEFSNSDTL